MNGLFSELFRPLEKGMCRLSPKGIAVKTSSGFTACDRRTGNLIHCDNMVFDLGENAFFVVPSKRVKEGDIIIDHGKPAYVKSAEKNAVTVLDYETGHVETLVPKRYIFMEDVYFFQKIVSLFGDGALLGGKKGMGKIMRMMMISQMLKGSGENGQGMMSGLMPLLLLKNFGASTDPFEGLADIFEEESEEEEKEEED